MTTSHFVLELEPHPAQRRAPPKDAFHASPKRLEEWLRALPMANVGEAGRRLLEALVEVNRLQLSAPHRFRIVERLRDPVHSIALTLEGHYMDAGLPLDDKKRHLVTLAFAFQDALASGYELVLYDLQREKGVSALRHKSMTGICAHRALHHLGRILLMAYQVYSPYPANVWLRLHRLFRFARDRGLEDRRVVDPERNEKSSATEVYKQVLLLSLCSPYRLRQTDLGRIYRALEEWAGLCDLTGIEAPMPDLQGRFGIPFEADAGPRPLALGDGRGQAMAFDCVLDTERLARTMRKQYSCLTAEGHPATPPPRLPEGIDRHLMCRVMTSWKMLVEREFPRRSSNAEVELTVGICSLFCRLGDARELDAARKNRAIKLQPRGASAWIGQPTEQNDDGVYRCRLVDESERGYRLRWPAHTRSKARVGELLGVRKTDPSQGLLWNIGVVRWMRSEDESDLEVGVELLAPLARGLPVRLCDDQGECGDYVHGLLLPPMDPVRRSETLVLPTCTGALAAQARLLESGQERPVELTGLLESSNAFSRYRFRYVRAPVEKDLTGWAPGHWNADDFERVWDHL